MLGIWDIFLFALVMFYIAAYIYVVALIIIDLFRDHTLAGGWKALWIIFLVIVPFLTALVYVIARGRGMAARASIRRGVVPETDDYRPAAAANPTAEIERAKALLDAGTISQGEFDTSRQGTREPVLRSLSRTVET